MCGILTRRRRQVRKIWKRRQLDGSPEKAFSCPIIVTLGLWGICKVCAEHAAHGISNYQNEAAALAPVLYIPAVESGQSAAVLLERIRQLPMIY